MFVGGEQIIEFTPDGKYMATGGGDGIVNLWEAKTPYNHSKQISGLIKN
jgi:WD40 repeat protein